MHLSKKMCLLDPFFRCKVYQVFRGSSWILRHFNTYSNSNSIFLYTIINLHQMTSLVEQPFRTSWHPYHLYSFLSELWLLQKKVLLVDIFVKFLIVICQNLNVWMMFTLVVYFTNKLIKRLNSACKVIYESCVNRYQPISMFQNSYICVCIVFF